MNSFRNLAALFFVAFTALAQNPQVFDGGVVNGASFAPGAAVTPGSIVAIFGSDLASTLAQASSVPLSTSLDNVSVTFNGVPAPLFAVIPQGPNNPAQINAQLPWNVLPQGQMQGSAAVVVTNHGASSAAVNVPVGPFSPGIFAFSVNGLLRGIAINLDSSLSWPVGIFPGLPSHPAKAGDVIIILATGLGQVNIPVLGNGYDSSDTLRTTVTTPSVLFGGVPATDVQFSGLAPTLVGVNQINVVVPANAPRGGSVPLQIQVGGITSTDQVSIAIE